MMVILGASGVLVPRDAAAWEYTTVHTWSWAPSYSPVGSAIRNWGPADHVVIAVNDMEMFGDDGLSLLWMYSFDCSNNDDCATATERDVQLISGGLQFRTELLPSMGISRSSPSAPIEVSVVRRGKLEENCNEDADEYWELESGDGDNVEALSRDLVEAQIESTPGSTMTVVEANEPVSVDPTTGPGDFSCWDHEVSSTVKVDGDPWSCFAKHSLGWGSTFVDCATRMSPPGFWFNTDTGLASTSYANNPWLDFRDGERVISVSNILDDQIEVMLPAGALYGVDRPTFPALADRTPWSSLYVRPNGKMHLAWSDVDTPNGETTFQYSSCPASADCETTADWGPDHQSFPFALRQHQVAVAPEGGRNPQLVVAGDKQFLLTMVDPAGDGQNYGVYLTERCGDGAWSTPELVKTRSNVDANQRIDNGTPNIALNKEEQIVHVVFVEVVPNGILSSDTGEVYWARRGYEACN